MKLAIVGSRSFDHYEYMQEILTFHSCDQVISGGANGADKLSQRWAAENNIAFREFLPDWDVNGKSAGYLRNKQIIEACDEVVAFWDGKSKGTKHSIDLAEEAGKPIYIYWSERQDTDWIENIGV